MKFYKHFRTVGLYVISIFVAFSFPLTVFADSTVPPTTSTTNVTPIVVAVQPTVADTTTTAPKLPPADTVPAATQSVVATAPTTVQAVAQPVTATHPAVDTAPTTTIQPASVTVINSQSGAAVVSANATAGNATSGAAVATAKDATVVNSTGSLGTPAIQGSFTKDITGNSTGDITLNPLINQSLLGQGTATSSVAPTGVISTGKIDTSHSLVVAAASGNAAVLNNSAAGNATSGTAIANADVINIINSVLASHGSFVGTINIYGNLNGDILVSPSFLPQLVTGAGGLTQNTPPLSASHSSNVGVTNNVSLSATSGDAAVTNNSVAGNATTGKAATNMTVLNVVGRQLNAADSLLVFVNVMGKWVGTIVSSPDGATTAFLATGVQQDTSLPAVTTTNTNTSTQVTNNITVAARSGNATVSGNSLAGNATSGNAMASANILNLIRNTMNLSGWLGVLFINVFGNWFGSFGINTAYGDSPTTVAPVTILVSPNTPPPVITASLPVKTVMKSIVATTTTIPEPAPSVDAVANNDAPAAVLGSVSPDSNTPTTSGNLLPFSILVGVALLAGILYLLFRLVRRSVVS